VISKYNRG